MWHPLPSLAPPAPSPPPLNGAASSKNPHHCLCLGMSPTCCLANGCRCGCSSAKVSSALATTMPVAHLQLMRLKLPEKDLLSAALHLSRLWYLGQTHRKCWAAAASFHFHCFRIPLQLQLLSNCLLS